MKRFLSLMLVIGLVLTTSIPAFAEEADSKELEKAIMSVKNVVSIPSDYKDFQYSSNEYEVDGNKISVWNLNWNKSDGRAGISATVDRNGKLISFNKYTDDQTEGLGNISREAGKVIAADFLKKAVPDLAGNLKLEDNKNYGSTDRHNFVYNLYMNDVAVGYFKIYVDVDKHTGEVLGFYGIEPGQSFTDFPSKDGLIGLEDGQKAYLEQIGIKLSYNSYYDYNKKKLTIFPVYSIDNAGIKAIDAKTGKAVKVYQSYFGYGGMGGMERASKMADNANVPDVLTKEELEAVENISGIMSKEKAENKLREHAPGITADMKVTSTSLSKNYVEPQKYQWEIGLDGAFGIIDAKTGELISFYIYQENSSKGQANLTEERAKEKAESFIKQLAAEKFQQVKFRENVYYGAYQDDSKRTEYTFNYYRQVNGIEFTNNSIMVTVNKASGMITQYSCSWYDNVTFPSIDKAMTQKEAFDLFNKTGNFGLFYKKVDKGAIALVYDFNYGNIGYMLDPVTGNKLGWDGKPYKDTSVPTYTDLNGHWSEKTVKKLLENGYYLEGEKFNPNQKITQISFLRYLYSPMQPYYDDEEFYKMLIDSKVLKENEKAPKAELTRNDAAKFTVRYLGQGKSGEHPEIFINPFKDNVTQSYKGYAAISYGLGIMQGDSKGRFNGNKVLTNAEAATVIYKALQVQ